jgi:uncharacterized protein (TIGR02594 family)
MARRISEELADVANQLAAMDKWARSNNFARELVRSGQSVQQFADRYGMLGARFTELNRASLRNFALMQNVDKVQQLAARSTGGLTGAFARMGAQVRALTGSFGPLLGPTALAGAAIQMERMARATLNMANTARDLRQSRGELLQSIQAAQRLGLTFDEAQKEIVETTSRLEDIGTRGFGAMTEEMEKLGPFMFELINQITKMKQEGKSGNEIFQMYTKSLRNLTVEENIYVSRAMGHSTALRDINEQYKNNIAIVQASKEQADAYNQSWVTITQTLDNLIIVLGSRLGPAIVRAGEAMKRLIQDPTKLDPRTWKWDLKPDPNAEEKDKGLVRQFIERRQREGPIELNPFGLPKSTFDERFGGFPASPMSYQGPRVGAARSGRGIAPGGKFGGLTVPEGFGGPNAIVLTEQLRTEQESNRTLIEIRDTLQRMEGARAGIRTPATATTPGADGDAGPAFRRGVGPGSRLGRETRADRNNNPGNIKFGDFAKSMGATGADAGGFAIFPDRETGFKAAEGLLGGKGYAGKTLGEIGARWAAGDPNWARNVSKATGIPLDAVPTAEQRGQIARVGIPAAEGSARTGAGDRGATGVPSAILSQAREVAKLGPEALSNFMTKEGYPQSGAWCGQFAAAVVRSSGGVPPKGYAIASNWRNWGTPVDEPQPGDIAVRRGSRFGRGGYVPTGRTGSHVTTVGSVDPETGRFVGIGGNQAGRDRRAVPANYPIRGFEFRRGTVPDAAPGPQSSVDTPAAQRALIDGGGATNNKWEGSAALDITVAGAAQVNTRRSMGFEPIRLTRTRQMPRPTAESGTGAVDAYE